MHTPLRLATLLTVVLLNHFFGPFCRRLTVLLSEIGLGFGDEILEVLAGL